MNHQPFEEWLIQNKKLKEEEKRELDLHLRNCPRCAALAETGLALRAARMASPRAGFVTRFETRLAAKKAAERRQRLWGLILLLISGVGFFAWLAAPYLQMLLSAPAQWFTTFIGFLLFAVTSFFAFLQAALTLLNVIPNLIPPYLWMVFASALAGMGLLWTVSIWQLSRRAG